MTVGQLFTELHKLVGSGLATRNSVVMVDSVFSQPLTSVSAVVSNGEVWLEGGKDDGEGE